MKKSVLSVVSAAILIFSFCRANAQIPASFLDVNPDPHMTGLANAGSAMYATPFAMWNNTASTVFSENRMAVGVSCGMWQPGYAGVRVVSAAGYGRITKFMSLSAGIRYFSNKSYVVTDDNGVRSGKYAPADMTAGVGLAFRFAKIVSLSANLNYMLSDMAEAHQSNGVSADLGAMVHLKFMRVGLTLSHIGERLDWGGDFTYTLPANVKLGVSSTRKLGQNGHHEISATLEGGMVLNYRSVFSELGVEYKYHDRIRAAVGYHYGDADKYIPQYVSTGLGFKYWGISLDVSYMAGLSADCPVGNSFSVGLGYSF